MGINLSHIKNVSKIDDLFTRKIIMESYLIDKVEQYILNNEIDPIKFIKHFNKIKERYYKKNKLKDSIMLEYLIKYFSHDYKYRVETYDDVSFLESEYVCMGYRFSIFMGQGSHLRITFNNEVVYG